MLTFTDAQVYAWLAPMLWPFLRALALFTALPVFGQRAVPVRVRIGLALFIALASQATLPPMPVIAPDSGAAFLAVVQQVLIGMTLGFAVRLLFAAIELAGEIVGLQMGMGFASFFDPSSGGQVNAIGRFNATVIALLFIAMDGHLLVIAALVQSFQAFPVGESPMGFLSRMAPHTWGAEVFKLGLWIALPMVGMLIFTNLVLGMISRVAQQLNVFSIGFPITMGVGLVGLLITLPMLQAPFTMALERMLEQFR